MRSSTTVSGSSFTAMAIVCGCLRETGLTGLDAILGLPSPLKNRTKQFVIDGEVVVLGVNGVSDFEALYSHKHDDEAQLYAFDVLAMDGEELRKLPLSMRKASLARLLRGRPDGIFVAPFEQGEIGPDLFRAACRMGLEGMVSNHRDCAYRGGRCPYWVKVKNPRSPAMKRAAEVDWR